MDKSQLENSLKDMQEQLEHAKKVGPEKKNTRVSTHLYTEMHETVVFIDVQLNTDKDSGAGLK